jgi:hypothetical protein
VGDLHTYKLAYPLLKVNQFIGLSNIEDINLNGGINSPISSAIKRKFWKTLFISLGIYRSPGMYW